MPTKKPRTGDVQAKPLTPWATWNTQETAIDDLCDRIEGGETLTEIAASLSIHVAQVTRWIAAEPQRSARARESRIAAAASFDDQALRAIRAASDPFALSKAKEEAHHLRWKASKADPGRYGEKLELGGEVGFKAAPTEQLLAEAQKLAAKLGITPV